VKECKIDSNTVCETMMYSGAYPGISFGGYKF